MNLALGNTIVIIPIGIFLKVVYIEHSFITIKAEGQTERLNKLN